MIVRGRRRGQREGERGSVLVEMTLIVPLLVGLVLGMVEVGMLWNASTQVTAATRQGARVGSHLAVESASDREALLAFMSAMGDEADEVNFVVIYDPDSAGNMPAGCLTSSQAGDCNHYGTDAISDLGDDTKWECVGGAWDATWCPTSRDNTTINANGLGFYAQVGHNYVTGFFGVPDRTLSASTVMRLEPNANQ